MMWLEICLVFTSLQASILCANGDKGKDKLTGNKFQITVKTY